MEIYMTANKYYGQMKQDKIVHETFFRNKENGFFVELGAGDGITFSNTLFFEKHLGWNGICIEPNPFEYKKLKNNRNCILENTIVSNTNRPLKYLAINGYGKGLSGIVNFYDETMIRRIDKDVPDTSTKHYYDMIPIKMSKMFEKHGVKHVDYFSLDVEGAELNVLESIDFNKVEIKYFTIENNYKTKIVQDYLYKFGYRLHSKIKYNDLYVKF
jgi:FkbM family methyltransferase